MISPISDRLLPSYLSLSIYLIIPLEHCNPSSSRVLRLVLRFRFFLFLFLLHRRFVLQIKSRPPLPINPNDFCKIPLSFPFFYSVGPVFSPLNSLTEFTALCAPSLLDYRLFFFSLLAFLVVILFCRYIEEARFTALSMTHARHAHATTARFRLYLPLLPSSLSAASIRGAIELQCQFRAQIGHLAALSVFGVALGRIKYQWGERRELS